MFQIPDECTKMEMEGINKEYYYSMISSVALRFPLAPAAISRVRIALTVLPCFPITFPISLLSTFSLSSIVCSSGVDSSTFTLSGLSQF